MNIIGRLEYELAYYDSAAHHFNHYTTRTPYISDLILILANNTLFQVSYQFIGLVGRVFANGPGDLGSIHVRVIPKTLKMVLDTSLLNTQQYKVRIKGKVEQSREKSSAP